MLSLPDFSEKQIVIVFTNNKEKLSFKNDNLIVQNEAKEIIFQLTCHRIFCLIIVGHTVITSGLIERAKKFGFAMVLMKPTMRVYEVLNAQTAGNFLLRSKQYTFQNSHEIARRIVHNKVHNQYELIHSIRNKTLDQRACLETIGSYLERIETASDNQELLGLEGRSAANYFKAWFSTCNWQSRKPRIKHDPINLLLDMGYSYLFNFMECFLHLYGFDVYKGIFHTLFFQRKSLVCDMIEPFRCIIDKTIKRAYGLKQIQENDFECERNTYYLPFKYNQKYIQLFIKALMDYKKDMFLYVQSYYRSFMKNDPIEQYPFFSISGSQLEDSSDAEAA